MMRERTGSGGPRGLQILLSGVFDVRGGFDSHAFPPLLRRLAAALLLTAATTLAAAAAPAVAPDSVATPDSAVVSVSPGITHADTARHLPWHDQPRFVMLRSAVVPGWGQLHNRAWVKALLVAGGEGWILKGIVDDTRELDRVQQALDAARASFDQTGEVALVNEYNVLLDQRLGRQWLLAGVIAYAMIDAYVDATFRGFELEFRHDPALPEGVPVPGKGPGGMPGMRLALRWEF